MRDYADYFIDRKPPEKRGVSIHRDIDWWMEYLTGRMAKLLFIVLLALLALALKSFMQVGKSQVFFPIEHIAISGDVIITTPKDITEALAKIDNNSFFAIDLAEVSEQLTELPWVASATVMRRWPDMLAVNLVEYDAAYRWGDDELIDSQGHRFAYVNNSIFSGLPKLSGVDGFEMEVIREYNQFVKQLGISYERLEVEQFVLNKYLSWELHLQSGVVIKFGRDDYKRRMARFAEAFQADKLPDFEKLDVIDFRYNRGFAVKWKPEFAPETVNGKLVKVSRSQATDI